MAIERVAVIGLGYIGLPTAAMFASRKLQVIGVDVNPKAVETINRGEIHIIEPDLDMLVQAAVKEGYLSATLKPEPADAFLIAVPTPFIGDDHEPDLRYIEAACASIAPVLAKGNLVVLESTSPVGATEKMAEWLAAARSDLTFPQQAGEDSDIRVAHCPERVLPGKVMQELVTNDRVIGGMTELCSKAAVALYSLFVRGDCVVASSPRAAEMAKLTENSYRDVNIAFANELSMISDKLDIDIGELISLANLHPRVNILQPGPGVGGHCIAVDPWFIVSSAPNQARLIRTAREVNDAKPEWVIEKIHAAIGVYLTENPNKTVADVSVACYGITYKPDIDDMRESPAFAIVQRLNADFCGKVVCVEPNILELPHALDGAEFSSVDDALIDADVHVVLVAHKAFQNSFREANIAPSRIVDTCGLMKNL